MSTTIFSDDADKRVEFWTYKEKANLFAEKLFKTFFDDNNTKCDAAHEAKVDEYFESDQMERETKLSRKRNLS